MKRRQRQFEGFTLVELMVALIVASIVLAAVSTLANAAISAKDATDDMGRSQADLRMVSQQLTDLIQRANKVIATSDDSFELWHDTNADGQSTADELTTVSRGADDNTLTIGNMTFSNCQNISFGYDAAAPDTQLISVWFSLVDNGQTIEYSVSARLRCTDQYEVYQQSL